MSSCITLAGEALIASLQAQGLPLVIDTMIFAYVPDLDPVQQADRGQTVPAEHVVHTAAIPPEFRSFVNPNQVVYSVLLGSDVGDFTFNWQGLYCSEHGVLIAVAELPAIEKRANDAGTNAPGNNLTRNFMLQFTGAQALTGLTVEAEVWQLDFTVRLKGIDERERLSNRDIYGRAAFIDDGWLLANNAGVFHFEPGLAYVEGIRAALAAQTPAAPTPLPCDVYLDACMEPQGSDVVTLVTPRFVAEGAGLPDYTEGAPFHTPHYCVQVAHVAADGTVTDLRPKAIPLVDRGLSSHNTDPEAHPDIRALLPGPTSTAFIGGGALTPSTTNGATLQVVEDEATGLSRSVMIFGADADSAAEWEFTLPDNWNGALRYRLLWTATGGNPGELVAFTLAGLALAGGDALDQALGAAVVVNDAFTEPGRLHVTPPSALLSVGDASEGWSLLRFKLARDHDYNGGGAGAALAEAVQLIGVEIEYGTSGRQAAWQEG